MANLKSSKKDIKRSGKKQLINGSVRTSLKTYIKKVRLAVASGDQTKAAEAMSTAQRMIDKAIQRGIIHKNQGARRKARIAGSVANIGKDK